MTRAETLQKELLEQEIAFLTQQIEAAYEQKRTLLSDAEKISIDLQIKNLFGKMEQAEAQLKTLEHTEKSPAQHALDLETYLPAIDFQQAAEHVQQVLDRLGSRGGAALFFLQNSYLMGGAWFIRRIKDRLKSVSRSFREYNVGVSDDMRPDEFGIISRLAEYFGVSFQTTDGAQGAAARIVDYLCGGEVVRTKDIIFIEIRGWGELDSPDSALQRFIEGFWQPLVQRLPTITQYEDFKFIAFITAEDKLPEPGLPASVCCQIQNFQPAYALELTLTPWTPEDVRDLCGYTGRTSAEITRMAGRVYQRSQQGIPQYVSMTLTDYLRDLT